MSKIDRRDFINGSLMLLGSSVVPAGGSFGQIAADESNSTYPPALSGLRESSCSTRVHIKSMDGIKIGVKDTF